MHSAVPPILRGLGRRKILRYLLIAAWAMIASDAMSRDAVRVVDGDTLDIGGVRYRLHGIDAPEAGQACAAADGGVWPCGKDAIQKIEELVEGRDVSCAPKGRDSYGRVIAICFADGTDVNSEMVSSGFAWAFRKFSEDYAGVEQTARRAHAGVWQAETEAPWDYRALKWDAAISDSPDRKCPIKGNINRQSERIYHTPWSRDYAKTKINTATGERWFCSEDEAVAAGWRPPIWGR
ncbi:thermonuclease family protein [Sinorhizobium meliloti]|uniref:thermonuclease family protein n=1 Tax=Rhizobium meliloti TaxID=382 RepID=UPI001F2BE3B3|nr:thermonuclease family protein [Sinorhizobium meliloti]